jgi:hypothetical protein
MAHWNYRVVDHGDRLALHEVFYADDGKVTSWTAEAVTFATDSENGQADLVGSLEKALEGAQKPMLLRADLPG